MEFYHIVNRGVEKRNIFESDADRWRFLHSLFVFNDTEDVSPNHRHADWQQKSNKRELLVYIHAFCLMDNHYHLLISPVRENGMSLFMKKLNMGYAKYFNEKYSRSGALWQGKFRKVLIFRDAHFMYVPYYIHCNPLDKPHPSWRDGGVSNIKSALQYLTDYRWSSHLDYMGIKNVPSIIHKDEMSGHLGSADQYTKNLVKILSTDSVVDNLAYNMLELE